MNLDMGLLFFLIRLRMESSRVVLWRIDYAYILNLEQKREPTSVVLSFFFSDNSCKDGWWRWETRREVSRECRTEQTPFHKEAWTSRIIYSSKLTSTDRSSTICRQLGSRLFFVRRSCKFILNHIEVMVDDLDFPRYLGIDLFIIAFSHM